MPSEKPTARMRWWNLLFLHYRVPVADLRPLVPDELTIDTYDGTAWIGLVPFSMSIKPAGALGVLPPHQFHECNVRTYVTHARGAGVWFHSLDATSRPAVWAARRFWHLNYQPARIDVVRDGDETTYTLERQAGRKPSMRCVWRAGSPRPPHPPGTLEHFLTERYLLYAADPAGGIHAGAIDHEPWPLRDASVVSLHDELIAAAGVRVDPDESPLAYYAETIDVAAWGLERL